MRKPFWNRDASRLRTVSRVGYVRSVSTVGNARGRYLRRHDPAAHSHLHCVPRTAALSNQSLNNKRQGTVENCKKEVATIETRLYLSHNQFSFADSTPFRTPSRCCGSIPQVLSHSTADGPHIVVCINAEMPFFGKLPLPRSSTLRPPNSTETRSLAFSQRCASLDKTRTS